MLPKTRFKRFLMNAGDCYPALLLAVFLVAAGREAQAAPISAPVTGEIERIILNDPADVYSGGKIVVGGVNVILPRNLLIDLPANRLSLQQIFAQAPAGCIAAGESGLAKTDGCNQSGTGGFATISAVQTNAGDIIAGDVFIEKGREAVSGRVTYIDHTNGYFRVNGLPNDPATGVMVRLNDPTGRHTVQQGDGCAGGPNCSADPRFTLDPDNYVITFSTGYPVCIPSTVPRTFVDALGLGTTTAQAAADGSGDILCPDANRQSELPIEPPVNDSRRFAPLKVGDSVVAEGNFERIGGVRFVSAHTMRVNKALSTRNDPGQPDYLFLEEVFIEAPGFQNARARAMWIGFTTLAPTDVDIWSLHRDPATNSIHEFPLASVRGCDLAAGAAGTCSSQGLVNAGANIFKIRYDVDFLMAATGFPGGTKDGKLSPCAHLRANPRWTGLNLCPGGATFANQIGVISPVPHEIQARTGHSLDHPGLVTVDVRGNQATNGQYLFPLGMNLGGLETAEMNEVDLNQLSSPVIFEGIPWNLDRRLSPSGCLNAGGCESTPQPLDPFPYSGLDPRNQAELFGAGLPTGSYNDPNYNNGQNPLSNVRNRIFSYVDGALGKANGNNTVLPYALGTFPADPGLQPQGIIPLPPMTLACLASDTPFGPVAVPDTAAANPGAAVVINVTANDVAVFGAIDPASVSIVSAPTGTAVVGGFGDVAYTAPAGFSGVDTFIYTVRDFFGAVSNPAIVSVTVLGPPVASPDSASTNKGVPVVIPVLVNDVAPLGNIDVTSVRIETQGASGRGAVNINGTITYTPNPGVLSGTDTGVTYTVANTSGSRSNAAVVTVTINNVNTVPLALNDGATTPLGLAVTIPVLVNDTAFGGAVLNPATVNPGVPAHGTAITNTVTGSVTYTPNTGYVGQDSFSYTVMDSLNQASNPATVSINVIATTPVANVDSATTQEDTAVTFSLTANDTDADGNLDPTTVAIITQPTFGSVVNLGNGSVIYTPNLDFRGSDIFSYTVRDALNAVSNAATVSISVTAVNDPPVAANDVASTGAVTPRTINLTANDFDVDGTVVTSSAAIVSGPANGTVVNLGTGSVIYTPNAGFSGIDSFTYTVQDNQGAVSAPGTVTVNVASPTGTVAVLLAQFRATVPGTGDWRVEGTGTPNGSLDIYIGQTISGIKLNAAPVTIDGGGRWRFQQTGPSPNAANAISVITNTGAARLAFPVSVK